MMRQGRGTEVLNPILCHVPRMRQVRVALCRLCRFMTGPLDTLLAALNLSCCGIHNFLLCLYNGSPTSYTYSCIQSKGAKC